jgi:hypothetical protein
MRLLHAQAFGLHLLHEAFASLAIGLRPIASLSSFTCSFGFGSSSGN